MNLKQPSPILTKIYLPNELERYQHENGTLLNSIKLMCVKFFICNLEYASTHNKKSHMMADHISRISVCL